MWETAKQQFSKLCIYNAAVELAIHTHTHTPTQELSVLQAHFVALTFNVWYIFGISVNILVKIVDEAVLCFCVCAAGRKYPFALHFAHSFLVERICFAAAVIYATCHCSSITPAFTHLPARPLVYPVTHVPGSLCIHTHTHTLSLLRPL